VIAEARTKAQAKRVEAILIDDLYSRRYGAAECKVKFSDFVETYYKPWITLHKRAAKSDFSLLNPLGRFFGGMTLGAIKQIHVDRYKRERINTLPQGKSTPRQPASINRELAVLSRLFSLARDNGVLQETPRIKLLREDNERKRYLSEDEERRLMDTLEVRRYGRLRPLVVIALNTGMRLGEIVGLRWQQIDFHRDHINVTNTKSGRDRVVPLNDKTRELLCNLRDTGPLRERVFNDLPRVSKSFSYLCKRAGIEDFHFHDLRHTFATRLADSGQNAFTMAALLGHSQIQMTARYAHPLDARLRQAVESLDVGSTSRHKSVTRLDGGVSAKTA
jgi:integrase